MKTRVLTATLAAMILCGANMAMATGGGSAGGGGSGGPEKDGSPGPDRGAAEAASTTVNEAVLAECARLLADRQIAQEGPNAVTPPTAEQPLDCNLPGHTEQN